MDGCSSCGTLQTGGRNAVSRKNCSVRIYCLKCKGGDALNAVECSPADPWCQWGWGKREVIIEAIEGTNVPGGRVPGANNSEKIDIG